MATSVGSISVTVNVKGDQDAFLRQTELNVRNALKAMADATVQRAQMLYNGSAVPQRSGTLSDTGIAFMRDNTTSVAQFGEGLTYGRYQEFGPDGKDYKGKKKEWDYTTPGTGAHYLQNAGDSVAKEGIKNYL